MRLSEQVHVTQKLKEQLFHLQIYYEYKYMYIVYQGFGPGYGGLVLGLSHFQVMTDRPQKCLFRLKVFKSDKK